MRWKSKYPEIGDTKITKRFAFLPIYIDGEYRWFEFVKYIIQYESEVKMGRLGRYFPGWRKIRFIDENN